MYKRQVILIAYLIFVVQLSDVLQYVWGKLIGRTKVAPNLSPSKTWEGLVGGALSATAIGTALYWMTPFSPWQAAGLCLTLTMMGFFGGLVMSAIKRDRGVKDTGHAVRPPSGKARRPRCRSRRSVGRLGAAPGGGGGADAGRREC